MREELKECFEKGYLTNEFATLAMEVARKQINKKSRIPESVRLDALSDFSLKLVRKWEKLNPEKYPLSYINLMASNSLTDLLRKFERELKGKAKLNEEKKEYYLDDFESYTPLKLDVIHMSDDQKIKTRKYIMHLKRRNHSNKEIARLTNISKKTIIKWIKLYEDKGPSFYKMDRRNKNGKSKG